jgi:hypothetical protein
MHVAQRFEHLLNTYRRPDGHRWTGQQLDEATHGVVPRSYFVNLQKGRIDNPGYEKLAAMAKAMRFAPALWFEEDFGHMPDGQSSEGRDIASKVEHLFDVIRHPRRGELNTNAQVARMTLGDLSEEDVECIRTGSVSDPTVG